MLYRVPTDGVTVPRSICDTSPGETPIARAIARSVMPFFSRASRSRDPSWLDASLADFNFSSRLDGRFGRAICAADYTTLVWMLGRQSDTRSLSGWIQPP